MVPGRAKGVLANKPSWRKDYKVSDGGTDMIGGTSENGEDAGVWVVVGDTADGAESPEIVFIGIVETMPGYHVEGSMVLFGGEEMPIELAEYLVYVAACIILLEGADRSLEISSIC